MPLTFGGMKNKRFSVIAMALCAFTLVVSCEKLVPPEPKEEEVLDGPMEDLTSPQLLQFLKGDAAFSVDFTAETGICPIFVSTS